MAQAHENNFDFIRFAAATMVWYHHCYALTSGAPDPVAQLIPFVSFGDLGVNTFFIVSGYFITQSYERNGKLLPFLRNRALRILPALFAVVLLSVFILGALVTTLSYNEYFANTQTWRYLRCLMIFPLQYELPGVFQDIPAHAVNGSLWTLQHEVRCYAVIALLGFLGILRPRVMAAIFLCLTAILAYMAWHGDHTPEKLFSVRWMKLYFAVHLAFLFCGGAMIYLLRQFVPRHVGFLTFCVLLVIFSTRLPAGWGTILFDFAMIYSVIYLGFLRVPLLPKFGYFGDFSYGLYLWAFPMQQLTLHLMQGAKTPFVTFMLVSFAASLACAVLSWHLVEKQALRFKR